MLASLTPLHLIFYAFAAVAVGSAIAVITVANPVRSVLSLVITFFAMAGIWMILHAEFLSLILLLVYVGAVMTLFLFVVMMLNIDQEDRRRGFVRYLPFALGLVVLTLGLMVIALAPYPFNESVNSELMNANNTIELSKLLYTDYAYPLEIAGVLLLAAIVAAIALAHREPTRRKVQNPSAQIAVQAKDRVRLIKMPARRRPSEPQPPPAGT